VAVPATVRVPGGEFWMGSEDHFPHERPRHRVFIEEFTMAETTVTRSDYRRFLEAAGHTPPRGWDDPLFCDPTQPVVGVSWFDAVAYARWLSEQTGESWRLPTEAEWERAARGGGESDYFWGDELPRDRACYLGDWCAPHPVGEDEPNGYGLFNMGDNVHEWCRDWYAPDYYAVSPGRNPDGPVGGTRRVSRGGSWRHAVKASRAAHRSSLPPGYRYTDYGFRLVRALTSKL
jgi:formylglycine-generating enzyme required for sulfatase activity